MKDKSSVLIGYFDSLFTFLVENYSNTSNNDEVNDEDNFYELDNNSYYDVKDDVSVGLYNYILSNNDNFLEASEIINNYYGVGLDDLDKKDLLLKYIFAVYYLTVVSSNVNVDDDICNLMRNNVNNFNLFSSEEVNDEMKELLINNLESYIVCSDYEKKCLALKMEKDEYLSTVVKNNEMVGMLLLNNVNLEISNEVKLIEEFKNAYKNILFNNESDLSIHFSEKLKKYLLIKFLSKGVNTDNVDLYAKYFLSFIIKDVYSYIYISTINNLAVNFSTVTEYDVEFYNLINSKKLSFNKLMDKFVNDKFFSKYLLDKFYAINVSNTPISYEVRNKIFEDDNLKSKIKKYIVRFDNDKQ